MKRMSKVFLAASLVTALSVQDVASDEKKTPELKTLLQEIKSMRLKIERLELRIKMLERNGRQRLRYDGPVGVGFPTDASKLGPEEGVLQRENEPFSLFEWRQHEMPWSRLPHANDKGLYVFPGLDAPPSSPMNVPIR